MKTKSVLTSLIKTYFIPLTVLLLLTILYIGCDEDESTSPPADPNSVSIQNLSFNPGNLTVSAGTTVRWTNNDNVAHTVTSGSPGNQTGLFDSGNLPPGGTFEFTFSETGTFNYFCTLHPAMTAQVTAQ